MKKYWELVAAGYPLVLVSWKANCRHPSNTGRQKFMPPLTKCFKILVGRTFEDLISRKNNIKKWNIISLTVVAFNQLCPLAYGTHCSHSLMSWHTHKSMCLCDLGCCFHFLFSCCYNMRVLWDFACQYSVRVCPGMSWDVLECLPRFFSSKMLLILLVLSSFFLFLLRRLESLEFRVERTLKLNI